jgi:hypothetical protein
MPFFIFIYSGIIYWSLFEQGINLAKNSLVWNRELVTKTAFPKETLPFSFIFSKITDLDMSPKNYTLNSLDLMAIRFHILTIIVNLKYVNNQDLKPQEDHTYHMLNSSL